MTFNIAANTLYPDYGKAALGGLQKGQDLRKGALDMQQTQQKGELAQQQQQALGGLLGNETPEGRAALGGVSMGDISSAQGVLGTNAEAAEAQEVKQKDFLARAAYDILQAPTEMQAQMHDDMIRQGIQTGALPQEAAEEIGQFGEDDIVEMQNLVRGGQGFKDVIKGGEAQDPMSVEGKIQADIDGGRISPAVGQAAIKKALTSSGFSVEFGEDGRVSSIKQGASAGLQKPTKSKIEEKAFNAAEMGARVKDIKTSFKPEYLELKPRGKMAFASMKDFLGVDLSTEDTKQLTEFTTFKRRSVENLSRLLNELSGAAINAEEFKRLSATMPSSGTGVFDGDSPTVFKAKMDDVLKQSRLANLRYSYALSNGLNPLKSNISLADIPDMIDERGGKIEQELRAQMVGATEEQIETETRKRLITEFGMQ